jgi:hypothetical protein
LLRNLFFCCYNGNVGEILGGVFSTFSGLVSDLEFTLMAVVEKSRGWSYKNAVRNMEA